MLLFFLLGSNCQTRESMHCGCWHSDRYVAIAMEEFFVACWNPILQDIRCPGRYNRGDSWSILRITTTFNFYIPPKHALYCVWMENNFLWEKISTLSSNTLSSVPNRWISSWNRGPTFLWNIHNTPTLFNGLYLNLQAELWFSLKFNIYNTCIEITGTI